jgi:peptide/nickel transport system permease protein
MIRKLLLRRTGFGIFTLLIISIITFLVIHILPGNAAIGLLGKDATPYTLRVLTKQLGLNEPVPVQYWHWIKGLFTLNWGTSLVSQLKVSYIVETRAENTAVLAVSTLLIATPLAILIGSLTAMRSGKVSDNVVSLITLVVAALPGFVIGILLIYFLAANVFHVLPAASIINPQEPIFSQLQYCVLPIITLVLTVIPYQIRMVRATVIDVLQSDYIMMARLKGLPERYVLLRHAVRNALAPIIQTAGLNLLLLTGGVAVIETVFSYPGIGYALVESVNQRDIPVVQTIAILITAAYVTINLLADLAVVLVTPRLRARL